MAGPGIKIISVGKIKQDFVLAGEEQYLTRLRSFADFELVEVPAQSEHPESVMKELEAKAVLSKVEQGEYLIILDESGKSMTSQQMASWLQGLWNQGRSQLCFAIGGSFGWDASVKTKAQAVLSLSPMTFTYQMTRLILIEQLYRAMTILKGIAYHK